MFTGTGTCDWQWSRRDSSFFCIAQVAVTSCHGSLMRENTGKSQRCKRSTKQDLQSWATTKPSPDHRTTMAKYPITVKPATKAMELCKKRYREEKDEESKEGGTDFSMNKVFQQASLLETTLSFPIIEWSSDEEEEDCSSCNRELMKIEHGQVSYLAVNGMKASFLEASFEVLESKTEFPSHLSNKKRKLSTYSKPHMVRSFALGSDLSNLASCWWIRSWNIISAQNEQTANKTILSICTKCTFIFLLSILPGERSLHAPHIEQSNHTTLFIKVLDSTNRPTVLLHLQAHWFIAREERTRVPVRNSVDGQWLKTPCHRGAAFCGFLFFFALDRKI